MGDSWWRPRDPRLSFVLSSVLETGCPRLPAPNACTECDYNIIIVYSHVVPL